MATLAGFTAFLRNIVGITTLNLPDCSPVIPFAYEISIATVNLAIRQASCIIYDTAVYNLATDTLINYAPDQVGQSPPKFFEDLRESYSINAFVAGVISSTSDQATGETMLVPDFFKGLTFSDLAELKTPYGRAYLAIAQKYGTLWGLTT